LKNKNVAILQSGYIPWKGYFDIINIVDLFIFYDDVQFTTRDWRSRNRIKTKDGLLWLSVPCGSDRDRLICDVAIKDNYWQRKHWETICHSYAKAEYFAEYRHMFEDIYLGRTWSNLSEMNQYIIRLIAQDMLGITTPFGDSRDYSVGSNKGARILDILDKVEATEYLSGPSAKSYLDPEEFKRRGIKLTWMDYSGYPEYRQLYPPFVHEVSVIDLIFNEGPNARKYLKSTA